MSRRLGASAVVLAVLVALMWVASPSQAAGKTFVVNATANDSDLSPHDGRCDADPGPDPVCTLQAAIQQANATTAKDSIEFDIPGDGPHTINRTSTLTITQPVIINGWSEPGSAQNSVAAPEDGTNATLKVYVRGPGEDGSVDGFALTATARGSVIAGLAIANFDVAIDCGADRVKIVGNFLGTDTSGGILEGNGRGVYMTGDSASVGGSAPPARNLISGSQWDGLTLYGHSHRVSGNLLGTKRDASQPLGNGQVYTQPAVSVIGKRNFIGGNVIAWSGSSGIEVLDGVGNTLSANRSGFNGGLGIDLVGSADPPQRVTPNDALDVDAGPNRLQNFPVLTGASTLASFTSITGTLDSTPSTKKRKRAFVIEFFSVAGPDGSGHGEADQFLGRKVVRTNRRGHVEFTFAPDIVVPVDHYVTATATDKRTGDTSEFAQTRKVTTPSVGGA